MSSINSSTFTEIELSVIAICLYLVISPIHGVSKITKPLLKILNVKTPTSLLLFTGLLFGVIYYLLIELVLHPLYKKMKKSGFKVGGQADGTNTNPYIINVSDDVGGTSRFIYDGDWNGFVTPGDFIKLSENAHGHSIVWDDPVLTQIDNLVPEDDPIQLPHDFRWGTHRFRCGVHPTMTGVIGNLPSVDDLNDVRDNWNSLTTEHQVAYRTELINLLGDDFLRINILSQQGECTEYYNECINDAAGDGNCLWAFASGVIGTAPARTALIAGEWGRCESGCELGDEHYNALQGCIADAALARPADTRQGDDIPDLASIRHQEVIERINVVEEQLNQIINTIQGGDAYDDDYQPPVIGMQEWNDLCMLEDDATGTSTLRTEDDTDFDAGWGGCETYIEGGGNHYYCDKDIQDNRCSNAPDTCTCIGVLSAHDDVCIDLSPENCTTNENCRIEDDNYCYDNVDPARCTFAMEACPVACRICANPPLEVSSLDQSLFDSLDSNNAQLVDIHAAQGTLANTR